MFFPIAVEKILLRLGFLARPPGGWLPCEEPVPVPARVVDPEAESEDKADAG